MRSDGPRRRYHWCRGGSVIYDTLGEINGVITGGLNEDRTIWIHSIDMYMEIVDFERMVGMCRTAHVATKYKIVDRKVRQVAAPLLENSQKWTKGVAPTQVY